MLPYLCTVSNNRERKTHMKRTNKTLLLALMALTAMSSQADDKVVVVTSDGQTAYNIDEVKRIDFADDQLNVVKTDGEGTTYAFDNVKKLVFTQDASAIEAATTSTAARLTLTISPDGTMLTVNGWNPTETATLTIYGVSGTQLLAQRHWNGQPTSIAQLPHGIYVVKAGRCTAKFRK